MTHASELEAVSREDHHSRSMASRQARADRTDGEGMTK